MNLFTLQGQLLYKEAPKHEGGSALAIIGIGKEKEEKGSLIQHVNKVIVRFPARISHILNRFAEDDFLEITGSAIGRVYYPFGTKTPISTLNLVAGGVHPCSVSHLVSANKIHGRLFAGFTMTGLVKAVSPPKKEGAPHTLFLQIERPINRDEKVSEQPTAVIPISVLDSHVHKLSSLEAQMAVVVNGNIRGVLRKMPIPEVQDAYEERLEIGLILGHVQQCSIIPTKIFESRQERSVRKTKELDSGLSDIQEALAEAEELPSDDATA